MREERNYRTGFPRSLAVLRVMATLFVFIMLICSCGKESTPEQSIVMSDVPDQEFFDFTTVESDSSVEKWKLEAPVARIYNARNLLVAVSPRIVFYDEAGGRSSILTAEKGEYNKVTHDLTALGNVVVTSREGYTLETESLVLVKGQNRIQTEDFVRFTKENDVLTGYGFRSDPELSDVVIERDVKAYLRDEGGVVLEELEEDREGEEDSNE